MKRTFLLIVFTFLFASTTTYAQDEDLDQKIVKEEIPILEETAILEEDEGPNVFKFEPDFLDKNEERKAEIVRKRKIIDTLQVSERKRLKLIRDLYKVNGSNRLNKALLVDTKFEDIEE